MSAEKVMKESRRPSGRGIAAAILAALLLGALLKYGRRPVAEDASLLMPPAFARSRPPSLEAKSADAAPVLSVPAPAFSRRPEKPAAEPSARPASFAAVPSLSSSRTSGFASPERRGDPAPVPAGASGRVSSVSDRQGENRWGPSAALAAAAPLTAEGRSGAAGAGFEETAARSAAEQSAAIRGATSSRRDSMDPGVVREEEKKIQAVWLSFRGKSETVRQYERDWFSYPDLAELTFAYKRDHNPVAFMKGLIVSGSFRELLLQYARKPVMRQLLSESVRAASPEASRQAEAALGADHKMTKFVDGVARMTSSPEN